MDPESSKKIDEIMFKTNDKINAIVEEIRLIRFSKMDENEKEKKCDELLTSIADTELNTAAIKN